MQTTQPVAWTKGSTGTDAPNTEAPASTPEVSQAVAQGASNQEYPGDQNNYASASLYIGDLAEDITEPILYEVFSQPASVASIRICRDSQTQKSLGYGYVNYHTIPDAERAMDVLNFSHIKGRPCRIMWANRDKASRAKSENNVFVKNLDRNIDNKSLFDTFSLFGTIISCKVATDAQGRSLGYGYVQYEKEQSLIDAIKRVNGMQIGNNTVYCGRHIRREDRQSLRDEKFTNLYVKGYDSSVTSGDDIKKLFEPIGVITSSLSKTDDKGRECQFINMESFEQAKEAINVLNGRRFDSEGKLLSREETEKLDAEDAAAKENGTYPENAEPPTRLYVTRHQSRAERDERLKTAFAPKVTPQEPQPTVLYTRHFPITFTDDDLKAIFEPYGIVTSAKVAVDEAGNSRGFGFVTMPDAQDAQKAITGLHDTTVNAPNDPNPPSNKLYVAYLEPKETRQSRLKAQIAESVWRPDVRGQAPQYRGPMNSTPGFPAVMPGHRMPNQYPVRRGGNPMGPRGGRQPNRPAPRTFIDNNMQFNDAQFYESISNLGFKEQKQAIGDRLYHVIMARQPTLAGKITGMMLEMPNEDLLNLLQRPDELSVKIDEAIEVLKAAQGTNM